MNVAGAFTTSKVEAKRYENLGIFITSLIPPPKLPPKLRGIAFRLLGKQVIDCPVDSHAGLEMLVLLGQIEPQTRIPIAANLCIDYFLEIQHVVANTFDRVALVHIAGCTVLLEALAQLLLLSNTIQHAGTHHSQKAITLAQVPFAAKPYPVAQNDACRFLIEQEQFPRIHFGAHVLPWPLSATARKGARLHVVIAKAVARIAAIDDMFGQQDNLVAGLGVDLPLLFDLAAGAL